MSIKSTPVHWLAAQIPPLSSCIDLTPINAYIDAQLQ
jgi:hypothetical protein